MKLRVRSSSKLQMSAIGFIAIALSSTLSIAQAPPHLLLSTADFTRLNELARTQPWAAKQKQAIIAGSPIPQLALLAAREQA